MRRYGTTLLATLGITLVAAACGGDAVSAPATDGASPSTALSPTTVSIMVPGTGDSEPPQQSVPADCPQAPSSDSAVLGVEVALGPLDLVENTPTTYLGPDVDGLGYTISDTTGAARTLALGIAMLYVIDDSGEVISAPAGVEDVGIGVQLDGNGDAVAPFVWNPIDCRTQRPIEPGTYRAILDLGAPGVLTIDELVIT